MTSWVTDTVKRGEQLGRTISFPTINLNPDLFPEKKHGIYSAWVMVDKKKYKGALFFGQRLVKNETHTVLEIYLLDFDQNIYGKIISYQPVKFIRDVLNFKNIEEMRIQIQKDIDAVRQVLPPID